MLGSPKPEQDPGEGNLPEIAPPNRMITPQEIAEKLQTASFGVGIGIKDWDFSVKLGSLLGELAGTKMDPEATVKFLLKRSDGVQGASVDETVSALLGEGQRSDGKPLVTFQSGSCQIQAYAGRDCPSAQVISAIGSQGDFSPDDRKRYQAEYLRVAKPVFAHEPQEALGILGLNREGRVLSIDDDCAASIATVGGIEVYLHEIGFMPAFRAQEINVGVVTGQSLVMMVLLAERWRVPTLIRFAWMEHGLTWGEAGNYIANTGGKKTGLLSVGDMGSAAARVPGADTLLELVREDDYYDRGSAGRVTWSRIKKYSPSLRITFAMGGLMTEGIRKIAGGHDPEGSLIVARASRQHQGEEFYVLMSHLVQPLAEWAAAQNVGVS